jgi:hypothetical protein
MNEQGFNNNIYFMVRQTLMGQGLRMLEASQSHSNASHSLELPWTSDQPAQQTLPDNTQKRQTSTPPAGFEPAMSEDKRLQNHALDRAATGIGFNNDPVLHV